MKNKKQVTIKDLVGVNALTNGIRSRAFSNALKISKDLNKNLENKVSLDNEVVSFNDLFNYFVDPKAIAVETYIRDKENNFFPENLKYMLNESIKYKTDY